MHLKSERLRKLETELKDLKHWLDLGLVPKKDIEKHEREILIVTEKIDEERGRLRYLKENGDLEEYVAPKKSQRQPYAEPHTIPDMDANRGDTESATDFESTSFETEATSSGSKGKETEYTVSDEEDDPFSDKNRWKRGVLEDPDSDNW